jgi:hypothetical protein
MANFTYDNAKLLFLTGGLNLATEDVRVCLVMSNSTTTTEVGATTMAGFTTLDQYDGSGYSAGGAPLIGEATSLDSTNHRAIFDANDLTFTALGVGSRPCKAAIVYCFRSTFGASIPLYYVDTGGWPFSGNGSNVTIQWNAAGVGQIT